jgi:Zn-dependent protease with chaperone function
MMTTQLQGTWFDGKTSSPISVSIEVNDEGFVSVVSDSDQRLLLCLNFSEVRVSSRIGNTPRYLYFPDGEKCETYDSDNIDLLLNQHRPSIFHTLAHTLESNLQFVILTLLLVVGILWGGVQYGIPATAKLIAYKLPQSVMNRAASESLLLLDKTEFEPSALSAETQARILKHFDQAIKENVQLSVNVIFRAGGRIGANAFALPDGTVMFTDEIVKLAKNDDELLAVFAHEIGHVKYRHALRSAIQGSVLSFVVTMLTGDMSAAAGFLSSLPLIVTAMSYSRDFEREADEHALIFLDSHKIPRHFFVDLMERLEKEHAPSDKSITGYFSTHPTTNERLKEFR